MLPESIYTSDCSLLNNSVWEGELGFFSYEFHHGIFKHLCQSLELAFLTAFPLVVFLKTIVTC